MCGFAGIFYTDDSRAVEKSQLSKMTSVLVHRGPDEQGYFVYRSIGLGHRRLKVIDLIKGAQPIFNENKNLSIVFNGEIYNYKQLRVQLLKLGHKFETNSSDRFQQHIQTFGDHLPEYDEVYTFRRYFLLGTRYHYRNDPQNLKKRLLSLAKVNHKYSVIAQIALAHGVFSNDNQDMLNPLLYIANEDFTMLENFLKSNKESSVHHITIETNRSMNTEDLFKLYYKLGLKLKTLGLFKTFTEYMNGVYEIHNSNAWIAKIGLAEGIFSKSFDVDEIKQKFNHFMKIHF